MILSSSKYVFQMNSVISKSNEKFGETEIRLKTSETAIYLLKVTIFVSNTYAITFSKRK